jgi:hypothetical protein
MTTVTGLVFYPLKGGRGIATPDLELDALGPRHDRRWMVVDGDGSLITQREVPRLCLVAATPAPEGGGLRLEAPGVDALAVPHSTPDAPRVMVRVWNDRCEAIDLGSTAAEWFSTYLGRGARLVYMPDTTHRRTDPAYDPVGSRVSFADGYPILLIGEESLAALNARLASPVPMNRFRPNIVVRGAAPFAEDEWRRFRIGSLRFEGVKPCGRCSVPTTDQATAERGTEPIRTLATFRTRGAKVLFGMNVVHRDRGTIRVGDQVMVEDG